ncbi:MAG: hypothetical protein QNK11_09855 [Legionella sp.]|nr:hypothetical protein [Legionella sp.]
MKYPRKCLRTILILSFLGLNVSAFAYTGNFFVIEEDESKKPTDTPVIIELCLNGNGPITCQNYTINYEELEIKTVVPHRFYNAVGLKVKTSGYTPKQCRLNGIGYCLLSVNSTTATSVTITSGGSGPPPP